MDKMKKKIITEYWLNKLSAELPKISLPSARPVKKEKIGTQYMQHLAIEISEPIAAKMFKIAKNSDIALFILALGGLNILLYRYTGLEDLVIGTLYPGQYGNSGSILFCRNQINGDAVFKDTIIQTGQEVRDSIKYGEYSFDDMYKALQLKKGKEILDIFNVAFIYDKFQNKKQSLDRFEITIILCDKENRLNLEVDYNKGIYEEETVYRFSRNLVEFFNGLDGKILKRISEIEVVCQEEKEQLLYEFNNTQMKYAQDKIIHGLFEEQVERTPHRIALVRAAEGEATKRRKEEEKKIEEAPFERINAFAGVHLSYRELNEQSDRLAYLLIEKCVLVGSIIGIMMERSVELIIGILGILKAGGAYLPIDPDYPRERIDFMVKDSGARLLVTTTNDEEGEKVRSWEGEKVLLDEISKSQKSSSYPLTFLPSSLQSSSNPAYVIYTSGTTGKPKGVMVEHRAVHNFMQGIARLIEFRPGKIILALTTITFDIFGLETLLPFCRGLKVIMADENHQREMLLLDKLIIKNCVDMLQATPTRMQMLTMSGITLSCLKNLKEIMVGGEVFPVKLLEDLKRSTGAKIYNMYGPTETTIWSSVLEVTGAKTITIGFPIANTQIYILNKYSKIQPVGVTGELHIGGDGLARGYINRPELTAEKFISSPHPPHPSLLYKTGDLGYWLLDGNIKFLGRIDNQVKIRGFRIELEEIENRLLKHEDIKEAVVLCREDSGKDKYLWAYITSDKEISVSELREYLLKHLPIYMIPSRFFQIDKIPITSTSKIDRIALEKMGEILNSGAEYSPPTTEMEKLIAEIWKEVLRLDDVGIFDNFFDLGGNSLNIVTINNKIKTTFERDIPDVKMFTYPTIHSLANYLSQKEISDTISDKKIRESVSIWEESMHVLAREGDDDDE